jgi:hypothetical protein
MLIDAFSFVEFFGETGKEAFTSEYNQNPSFKTYRVALFC